MHSDWSYDGKWSLDRLARTFSGRGYRAVLITEHDQGFDEERRLKHRDACRKASSDKILLVPGIEYSDPTNVIHLLVWGNIPFLGSKVAPERVLSAVSEARGAVVFAHPSRKAAWKQFKPEWKSGILGIELWNRKTDGWAPSRDAQPLLELSNAVPFVGMDFHDARQFFPMATILDVDAPVITEETVLAALRARRCASQAFGRDVMALSNGFGTRAFDAAESARRTAALFYRTFRSRIVAIRK